MIETVIAGSIGLDDIKTQSNEVKNILGGSGVYASLAASLFCKPGLIGSYGEDFPKKYLELLYLKGINLTGLQRVSGPNMHWIGEYEKDMNNRKTISIELNSLKKFKPIVPDEFKQAKFVLLGNLDPEHQLKLLEQFESPKFVLADTMDYYIETAREKVLEMINSVNVCLMNNSEAKMLFNDSNLISAGKKLLTNENSLAIIKKGEHGSILFSKKSLFIAPAYPLEKVVDPTGAGDSFAGAIIGFLSTQKNVNEKNLRQAIIHGSAVASLVCEGFSLNVLNTISLNEIKKRVKALKDLTSF